MKFHDYIGIGPDTFQSDYIDTGLVTVGHHKEFPLSIYTYGRQTVNEQHWDKVTSRCRGIIVNRETGDIVARPFEKFHNYGSTIYQGGTDRGQPTVWEKMDGFMITGYRWGGKWYAASKGSFHSIHAKWATRALQALNLEVLPHDWTPIFEGLHPDLRIVVDYGKRQELVMLSLIHIESGEEVYPNCLRYYADKLGCVTPRSWDMRLDEAVNGSRDTRVTGAEGYVLTWYHAHQPPSRLKLKFVEYLRLHRMVTGVSPKRIWEALASGSADIHEYVTNSTPWFKAFTQKWVRALTTEFKRLKARAEERYAICRETVRVKVGQEPYANLGEERKAWAIEFQRPENAVYKSILFAMLDNKDVNAVIWKQVKHMTSASGPMVDAHNT